MKRFIRKYFFFRVINYFFMNNPKTRKGGNLATEYGRTQIAPLHCKPSFLNHSIVLSLLSSPLRKKGGGLKYDIR